MCDLDEIVNGVRSALEIGLDSTQPQNRAPYSITPAREEDEALRDLFLKEICESSTSGAPGVFRPYIKYNRQRGAQKSVVAMKKGQWSRYEDNKLKQFFQRFRGDMRLIAERIPQRTRTQIRQRCMILRLI